MLFKGTIHEISFCYNMDKYTKLLSQKIETLRKQVKYQQLKSQQSTQEGTNVQESENKTEDRILKKYEVDLEKYEVELKAIESSCFQEFSINVKKEEQKKDEKKEDKERVKEYQEFMQKYFIGQAFITFKTIKGISRICEEKDLQFLREDTKAPDPTDINWENLYTKRTERVFRFGGGLLFNCGVVVVVSLLIYKLAWSQYGYTKQNSIAPSSYDVIMIQVYSYGMSICLFIINEILTRIVDTINQIKKFRLKTSQAISYTFFLSSAQFINSTVIPLLLLIYVSSADSFYSILYSPTGLIINQNSIFIINAITPLFMTIIDPMYWWKSISRDREFAKSSKSFLSQREAQKLYEDPEFQLSAQYGQAIKTIYMTFFYFSVMPICALWGSVALIIQYFTSKYLLLNRRVVLVKISEQLSFSVIILVKVGLVIYAVTCYLFLKITNSLDRPYIPSIIGIVIAGIHLLIPLQRFNEFIFNIDESKYREKNQILQDTYNKRQYSDNAFQTVHSLENPLLKRSIIQTHGRVELNKKIIEYNKKRQLEIKQVRQQEREPNKNTKNVQEEDDDPIKKAMRDPANQFNINFLQTQLKLESIEGIQLQLKSESLKNSVIENNSLQENKQMLNRYIQYSEYLCKELIKLEEKIKKNKMQSADFQKMNEIDRLMKDVTEKSMELRKTITNQMIEDRKSFYHKIEQPETMINKIAKDCIEDKSQTTTEKAQQYYNYFNHFNWIASYLNNYDKQLLENKDFQGNIPELKNIEILQIQLNQKRAIIQSDIENNIVDLREVTESELQKAGLGGAKQILEKYDSKTQNTNKRMQDDCVIKNKYISTLFQ